MVAPGTAVMKEPWRSGQHHRQRTDDGPVNNTRKGTRCSSRLTTTAHFATRTERLA